LREKDFKDILIAKPERAGVHPELEKIKQLVENAKNGIIFLEIDQIYIIINCNLILKVL